MARRKQPQIITLKINAWNTYNARCDSKNNAWFRMQASMPKDPKILALPVQARWLYIYLLSLCCDAGTDTVTLQWDIAWAQCCLANTPSLPHRCALVDAGLISILSDSLNSSIALDPSTNRQTDRQTEEEEQPHPKTIINAENKFLDKLPDHPVADFQIRMSEDFQKFSAFLNERKLDLPEIRAKAVRIYRTFGDFERFQIWVEQFRRRRDYKQLAAKDDHFGIAALFKTAILGECGLLKSRNEVQK